MWWWLVLLLLLERECSDLVWNSLVFFNLASHGDWRVFDCLFFCRPWKLKSFEKFLSIRCYWNEWSPNLFLSIHAPLLPKSLAPHPPPFPTNTGQPKYENDSLRVLRGCSLPLCGLHLRVQEPLLAVLEICFCRVSYLKSDLPPMQAFFTPRMSVISKHTHCVFM